MRNKRKCLNAFGWLIAKRKCVDMSVASGSELWAGKNVWKLWRMQHDKKPTNTDAGSCRGYTFRNALVCEKNICIAIGSHRLSHSHSVCPLRGKYLLLRILNATLPSTDYQTVSSMNTCRASPRQISHTHIQTTIEWVQTCVRAASIDGKLPSTTIWLELMKLRPKTVIHTTSSNAFTSGQLGTWLGAYVCARRFGHPEIPKNTTHCTALHSLISHVTFRWRFVLYFFSYMFVPTPHHALIYAYDQMPGKLFFVQHPPTTQEHNAL